MLNKNVYQLYDLYNIYQNDADRFYETKDFIQGKRAAEKAMIVRFAIHEWQSIEESEKYYEEAN